MPEYGNPSKKSDLPHSLNISQNISQMTNPEDPFLNVNENPESGSSHLCSNSVQAMTELLANNIISEVTGR